MSLRLHSAGSRCRPARARLEVIQIQAILRQVAVLPIRMYRLALSPLLPPACRFEPRCSEYAIDAMLLHGVPRGSWLTLRRILRCHPWSEAGVDHVPNSLR